MIENISKNGLQSVTQMTKMFETKQYTSLMIKKYNFTFNNIDIQTALASKVNFNGTET